MPVAVCLLRSGLTARVDAFTAGLQRCGYTVEYQARSRIDPGDLLVIWNRRGGEHLLARKYEAAGGRVIVAENGYISPPDRKMYALALNHHNGAGTWREGGPERWDALGIPMAPWRTDGDHILVLPQRGIGEGGVAMPRAWTGDAMRYLRTRRPIRLRRHPGVEKSEPYDDLAGAWCALTWGSGAAIKALVAGVPVFYDFPQWIGAPAAKQGKTDLEAPWLGDRLPMLRRLAWAQWSLAELESGEAFAWLLT
jgi:hypothetical protein